MWVAIGFDFIQPIFNMGEGFPTGDVIHQKCTDGTPIVRPSNGPEVLLARSVPNLQFDIFFLDWDGLGPELHADSHIVGCSGLVLDELQHYA